MPDEAGDIVVVANPSESTSGTFIPNAPMTAGGQGGLNIPQMSAQNRAAAEKIVEVDPDANDEDIVVIGRRIKDTAYNHMMVAMANVTISSPCLPSPISGQQLRGMLGSIKMKVTTKNYGEGRAGENLTNSKTTSIPVNVNATALKGYAKLSGGISYLLLHEVAHSLKPMRDFAKAQYNQWYAREGGGLTGQALADAYAKSPEFALNEARANTIAKAMLDALPNSGTFGFQPKHGYATC